VFAHPPYREMWEVENYIEGEKKEMVEIYEAKGVSKEDATTLVDVLSRYKVHHNRHSLTPYG
jgi:hypothetical protein